MTNKIIVRENLTDGFFRLLVLPRPFTNGEEEMECWRAEIERKARFYLSAMYGEENVNVEAINIVLKNDVWISGNLYTYTLFGGVCVPYYEWIYDEEFYTNSHVYSYNRVTKTYYTVERDFVSEGA